MGFAWLLDPIHFLARGTSSRNLEISFLENSVYVSAGILFTFIRSGGYAPFAPQSWVDHSLTRVQRSAKTLFLCCVTRLWAWGRVTQPRKSYLADLRMYINATEECMNYVLQRWEKFLVNLTFQNSESLQSQTEHLAEMKCEMDSGVGMEQETEHLPAFVTHRPYVIQRKRQGWRKSDNWHVYAQNLT